MTLRRVQLLTYTVAAIGAVLTAAFVVYCDGAKELFNRLGAAALAPYAVFAASAAVARHTPLVLGVLLLSIAAVGVAVLQYVDAFFLHVSGMSGLVLVIVPWYQLLASSALLLVCLLSRLRVARST